MNKNKNKNDLQCKENSIKSRLRQAGFTMLELMTVVVISGTLAAMGYAGYKDAVQEQKLNNYRKSVQRMFAEARTDAILSGEQVVFMVDSNYAIAGTGVDTNDNGRIDWVDSNGNGVPDPSVSAGFLEGELMRVIEYEIIPFIAIQGSSESSYEFVAGGTVGAFDTGCYRVFEMSGCPEVSQVVFGADGMVYSTDSILRVTPIWYPARFNLAVRETSTVAGVSQKYAMLFVAPGGIVEGYDPQ